MKDKYLIQLGATVMGIIVIAISALLIGALVMLLWNWLMPLLFDLPSISYIEGWGVSFLSGMLFKGTTTVKTESK